MKLSVGSIGARLSRRRLGAVAVLLAVGLLGAVWHARAQVPVTVQFSKATYTAKRTDGFVVVRITLSQKTSGVVNCQYSTSDGTATAPQDYATASMTAAIPAGSDYVDIPISVVANGETTPEAFTVSLSNPSSNVTLGAPSTATVWLGPVSDAAATVSFDASSWTYNENDTYAVISVTMTGSPTGPVTVSYSTSDGSAKAPLNYSPARGPLVWLPSEAGTSKTFVVPLVWNPTTDPTLTVNLTLSGPVNATLGTQSTAILNILDCTLPCGP